MGLSALLSSQILDASATGRSVITGADASAIRSTLGLGTLATQSPTGTPSASTFLRGDFSWQTIDLSGYLQLTGGTMTGRLQTPSILLAGNFSATAWTTNGVGLSHTARTLTDTSSTGTVATAYTNVLSGNTIAASNATTFTDYASLFLGSPSAGSNVTITNPFSLITQGAVRFGGAVGINAGTLNGTVLDIAQTWGGTGTYTGIKYSVTDSGPANAASCLMDLQVAGIGSRFAVGKDGSIYGSSSFNIRTVTTPSMWFNGATTGVVVRASLGLHSTNGAGAFEWALYSGGANICELRNSTNAQTFRLYGTYTDASNYRRLFLSSTTAGAFTLGVEGAGTGASGNTLTVANATTFSGVVRATSFTSDGTGSLVIDNALSRTRLINAGAIGIDLQANIEQLFRVTYAGTEFPLVVNRSGLTVAGRTLTGSEALSALDLSGTWNTTGTPTLIKANVTDTASNANSLLMDLQVGGSSRVSISKNAKLSITGVAGVGGHLFEVRRASTSNPGSIFRCVSDANYDVAGFVTFFNDWAIERNGDSYYWSSVQTSNYRQWMVSVYDNKIKLNQNTSLEWYGADYRADTNTSDLVLRRDAANTLGIRNSTNSQRLNLYGTYTDASNYRRLFLSSTTAGAFTLGVEGAGSGASGNTLALQTGGTTRLTIDASGNTGIVGSVNITNSTTGITLVNASDGQPSFTFGQANAISGIINTASNAFFNFNSGGAQNPARTVFASGRAGVSGGTTMLVMQGTGNVGIGGNVTNYDTLAGSSFVLTSGNAGLGTTSPAAKLDILDTTGAGSGSLQASALNIAQTWSTTGTPTAFKLNVTDTASNANSLLMDLQVGGTSRVAIRKDGNISIAGGWNPTGGFVFTVPSGGGSRAFTIQDGGIQTLSTSWNGLISFGAISMGASIVAPDVHLIRDAAGILALRNGVYGTTTAQTFRVYNTFTDASNYERAKIAWESNVLVIGTEKAGTGVARNAVLVADGVNVLGIGNTTVDINVAKGAGPARLNFANDLAHIRHQGSLILNAGSSSFGIQLIAEYSGSGSVFNLAPAGGVISQSYGTTSQSYHIYNTFTNSSNYERGKIAWESNVLRIGTEKAGTGSARALELQTDGTTRLTIGSAGNCTNVGTFTNQYGATVNDAVSISSVGTLFGGTNSEGVKFQLVCAANADSLRLASTSFIGFNSVGNLNSGSIDTQLRRNAAGQLDVRGDSGLRVRNLANSADADITAKAATFSGNVTVSAVNLVTDTTTGTKIGTATTQKLGLWNATPIEQPTTAVGSATVASPGGGSTIKTDDTFDGYTIQQVVKALRNFGLLA